MIQQAELRRLGGRWGVDQDVVERDYVLGWALHGLCQRPLLQETLVFKGGTALRKAYFADYRFSADLDFTGRQSADEQVLRSEVEAAAATVEQKSGILFRPVRWEKTLDTSGQKAYSARLEYVGPTDRRAGSLARLKLDITFYEEVVLPPAAKALLHPYSDADDCQTELLVYQLEEMAAEKLCALLRQFTNPDQQPINRCGSPARGAAGCRTNLKFAQEKSQALRFNTRRPCSVSALAHGVIGQRILYAVDVVVLHNVFDNSLFI